MDSRLTHPLRRLAPGAAGLALLLLAVPPAAAQGVGSTGVTEMVSHDSSGQLSTFDSGTPSISEDGRFVTFVTIGPLVPEDLNGEIDVYVLDRATGALDCASKTQAGVFGNNDSIEPHISADGRWVAFQTLASNFQPLDGNGTYDVYLKDMQTGALVRASNAHLSPLAGNAQSQDASVSDDGRYVAFSSQATNLVPNDTNGAYDVFLRDMQTGQTLRVSEGVWGQANGDSHEPMISGDGSRVAFHSLATNLILVDANAEKDVFVWESGFNPKLVSRTPGGQSGNGGSTSPSISADGNTVAFVSLADDLVAGDTNGVPDVYVFEIDTLTMKRASLTSNQAEPTASSDDAQISRDGRIVAFRNAQQCAPFSNNNDHIYVRNLEADMTWTASRPTGTTPNSNNDSSRASLAMGGGVIAFVSSATNMVPGDTNGVNDIFVRTMYPDPFAYCTSSTTSAGCQPNLTTDGVPSVSSGAFFTIIGSEHPNRKAGLLFYGFNGQASIPWSGATMCVAGAKRRTPVTYTGGSLPPTADCTGFFAFDMNGFAAGNLGGNPRPELSIVGQTVNVQFWGRDPQGPSGTYLSSAIEYVVGP